MLTILFLILWSLGVLFVYFIFDIPTLSIEGERHRRERLLQKQSSFLEALARAKASAYDLQESLYDDLAYKEIREFEAEEFLNAASLSRFEEVAMKELEELEREVQSFRDKHKFRDV